MQGRRHRPFRLAIQWKSKLERTITYEEMAWVSRTIVFTG